MRGLTLAVRRYYFATLRRNHEHQDAIVGALGEEADRAICNQEVCATRVEAIVAAAFLVAAVDEARSGRDVTAGEIAVKARAIGPVLTIESVTPSGTRVRPCRADDRTGGIVEVGPTCKLADHDGV